MTVIIFAGPSVHGLDIPASRDLVIRQPAMQGDIFRACLSQPRAIGLIDGYFDGVPSVWHKEILWALSQGIPVFGSASMGALRAAELDVFGMTGVGRIYQWYRDGVLEDDDEVALIHGPQETNYVPLSEPMVNVRTTCEAAVAAGVFRQATADAVLASAKHIHYRDRTWDRLLAAAQGQFSVATDLAEFCQWKETSHVNQKRLDAALLIAEILQFVSRPKSSDPAGFRFEWTDLWDKAMHDWAKGQTLADDAADASMAAIIDELRLDPELFVEIRSRALVRSILLAEADRRRVSVDQVAKRSVLARLREELGLTRKSDLDAWAKQNMLAEDKLDAFIEEEARIDKVSQPASAAIGRHVISILQSRGQCEELAKRAIDKRRALQALAFDQHEQAPEKLPPPLVLNWFFGTRRKQPVPADIDRFAQNLGLQSRQDFYRLLTDEYIYSSRNNSGDGRKT